MNSPLNSQTIVKAIPYSRTDEYLGSDTIEVNVAKRHYSITDDEDKILRDAGYVPLFDHLVIGWMMYIREIDAVNSAFFRDESLPIKQSRFNSVFA